MRVRNAIFSCAASGVLRSLLRKDVCSLNTGPLLLQRAIGSSSISLPPLPSADQKHHYLPATANWRTQSSLSALKNVLHEKCPRNGNFLMWLKCSILTSVDGSWIFKHLYAFFSIDMKDVLLQKKFISWTVLFHSVVGISAPDKSTFWSGAYLQICQGAHCMAMRRFFKSPD